MTFAELLLALFLLFLFYKMLTPLQRVIERSLRKVVRPKNSRKSYDNVIDITPSHTQSNEKDLLQ
jgi:CBS domain containing-hemolysin-like protein